tara:strand:- start:375 stop:539 length:165 start_codon:yes stop_codon:yes gene_type:complete
MKYHWRDVRWKVLAALFDDIKTPLLWALGIGTFIAILSIPSLIVIRIFMLECAC